MSEMKVQVIDNPSDLLNPTAGDLFLDASGNIVLEENMSEEVRQRITCRFQMWLNEWFLDRTEGSPWIQSIFQKAPSDRVIRSFFRQIILGAEGVSDLPQFAYTLTTKRQLFVTFTAKCVDGSLVRITNYEPFRVNTDAGANLG